MPSYRDGSAHRPQCASSNRDLYISATNSMGGMIIHLKDDPKPIPRVDKRADISRDRTAARYTSHTFTTTTTVSDHQPSATVKRRGSIQVRDDDTEPPLIFGSYFPLRSRSGNSFSPYNLEIPPNGHFVATSTGFLENYISITTRDAETGKLTRKNIAWVADSAQRQRSRPLVLLGARSISTRVTRTVRIVH